MKDRNYFLISLAVYVLICILSLVLALYFNCAFVTMIFLVITLAFVTSGIASYLELKILPKRQAKTARKKEKEVLQFIVPMFTGSWIVDLFSKIQDIETLSEIDMILCVMCVVVSIGILSWYYRNL